MTVADVFLDSGKATTDRSDQRGTVRVVQQPTSGPPQRFQSVAQDWSANPYRPPVPLFPGVQPTTGRRSREAAFGGDQSTINAGNDGSPYKRQRVLPHNGAHDYERPVLSTEREETHPVNAQEQSWRGVSPILVEDSQPDHVGMASSKSDLF